jgi:tRNA (guanine37-N1)-methyltransferase
MANKLKDLMKTKLSKKELGLLPSSFDVVGNIMIFNDFPKQLIKKEKIIGYQILKNYSNIRSVFKKTKKFSGRFRLQKLKLLAGIKDRETEHNENNARLKLDIEKAYFSSRLSNERKRVYSKVKKGERILVMFSGIGVYPVIIAKNTKAKEIYGIEVNPTAHNYALENLRLNKVENVTLLLGDVRNIISKINGKFERIIMPLPKGAGKFLDLALNKIKNKGIVHFYDFSKEDGYEKVFKNLNNECNKKNKRCKILDVVKCGQFSPGVYRICVDVKIL